MEVLVAPASFTQGGQDPRGVRDALLPGPAAALSDGRRKTKK